MGRQDYVKCVLTLKCRKTGSYTGYLQLKSNAPNWYLGVATEKKGSIELLQKYIYEATRTDLYLLPLDLPEIKAALTQEIIQPGYAYDWLKEKYEMGNLPSDSV